MKHKTLTNHINLKNLKETLQSYATNTLRFLKFNKYLYTKLTRNWTGLAKGLLWLFLLATFVPIELTNLQTSPLLFPLIFVFLLWVLGFVAYFVEFSQYMADNYDFKDHTQWVKALLAPFRVMFEINLATLLIYSVVTVAQVVAIVTFVATMGLLLAPQIKEFAPARTKLPDWNLKRFFIKPEQENNHDLQD